MAVVMYLLQQLGRQVQQGQRIYTRDPGRQ